MKAETVQDAEWLTLLFLAANSIKQIVLIRRWVKMKYFVDYKRTSWGAILIEAKNKKEAQKKFDNGDWMDELDNKSEYEYTSGVYK